MAAAQPGEYSGGIVKDIEEHDKGERGFICLELQCGIIKMPPGGLRLLDGRKEGECTILPVI